MKLSVVMPVYNESRTVREIVGHVLAVLGGRLFDADFCGAHAGLERLCTHLGDCSIRSVWKTLQNAIDEVLGSLTLKDLLVSEQEMNLWADARHPSLPTISQHISS